MINDHTSFNFSAVEQALVASGYVELASKLTREWEARNQTITDLQHRVDKLEDDISYLITE